MKSNSRKRIFLGTLLFVMEVIIFYCITYLLKFSIQEQVLFSSIYFYILSFYSHYFFRPILIWKEIIEMIKAHVMFLGIALLINGLVIKGLSLHIILLSVVMYCVSILLNRQVRKISKKRLATQLLVVGANKNAEDIEYIFHNNGFMFVNVLGYVDTSGITGAKNSNNQEITSKLISLDKMEVFISANNVEQVLIVDDNIEDGEFDRLIDILQQNIQVIKYRPKLPILQPYNTEIEDFDGNLFVSITNAKKRYGDIVIKKIIDILAGIVGCLLLIPLTIIVKFISVINKDNDPIFFTQDRIGVNGKIIKIYKFRSMVPNAEQVLEDLMANDPAIKAEYLENKKIENDPRITKVGSLLRRTSLDEIPQFINVLKGEMSLIGPRPYLPREKEDMGNSYNIIIKSKPGISGMWQANGRSTVGFNDRCILDEYYYENWSIWLDIIIIVKTIKSVIRKEGAL